MLTNDSVYRCYSTTMKNYLEQKGIRYFLVANDIVTNKKFYAFEKTEAFMNVLQQWQQNNPKNNI